MVTEITENETTEKRNYSNWKCNTVDNGEGKACKGHALRRKISRTVLDILN